MKKLIFATALAVLAILAVACGGDDSGGTQTATKTPAAATSAPAASSPAASQTGNSVDVKIQEWSINPTASSAPAGEVTLNIRNIGPEEEHELVILKTDLTPAELPKRADGAVDEEGAGITSPGEVEVGVGAQVSKTFTLTPGHYVFICNLIDQNAGHEYIHFKEGMHAEFTVQ